MIRSFGLTIAIAAQLFAAVSGKEFTYTHKQLPEKWTKAHFECWIPSSIKKAGPVKAIIISPNYQSDKNIYPDSSWRAFAHKNKCVHIRHEMRAEINGRPDRLANDQTAIDILDKAVAALAKKSGYKGLATANYIVTGLSQGASQTCLLTSLMPDRVLAAIPLHGGGALRSDKEKNLYGVPMLFLLGQKDLHGGTPRIYFWADGVRRKHNTPWAVLIEPEIPHQTLGNQNFVRLWLNEIIKLRLPKAITADKRPPLKKIDLTRGWVGQHRNTYDMYPTEVQIMPYKDFNVKGSRSGGSWLPAKAVAKAWKNVSLTGFFEGHETKEEIAAVARKTAKAIKIDGQLSEWKKLDSMVIPQEFIPRNAPWTGKKDCSMKYAIKYDAKNLYLGIRITDDELVLKNAAPWNQDGVEIRIDARPAILRGANKGNGEMTDFLLIAVGPNKTGEPYVFEKEKLPEATRVAAGSNAKGYSVEIAVPATYLDKMQGGPWTRFRMNIAIGDFDKDGKSQLWWRPDWRLANSWFGSGVVVKK